MPIDWYVTTFCNHPHSLKTGRPLGHECYVLDPKKLKIEAFGDVAEIKDGIVKEPRQIVNGRKRP